MFDSRTRRFRAALDLLALSQAHRLLGALTRGLGVVFTLHRVRPFDGSAFAPNHLLEITPEFLDIVLRHLRKIRYDLVTLDEALERLRQGDLRRFASFTFDDGFRDVRDHALPVLRSHGAPATWFVASEFADGKGDLWWIALEQALARAAQITFAGEHIDTSTPQAKYAAWHDIYWRLRAMDETKMRAEITRLANEADVDSAALVPPLCMNWDELRELARDPLVTIGNHTARHYMLARHGEEVARAEIADAQARIVRELNVVPRHLAYPVGDPSSAGGREFRLAREFGFDAAWTTRLGVLFPEHRNHTMALPRVSLNGLYQEPRYAELFVSGLPFAVNNGFRRLNVG